MAGVPVYEVDVQPTLFAAVGVTEQPAPSAAPLQPRPASRVAWSIATVLALAWVALGTLAIRHTQEEAARVLKLTIDHSPDIEPELTSSPSGVGAREAINVAPASRVASIHPQVDQIDIVLRETVLSGGTAATTGARAQLGARCDPLSWNRYSIQIPLHSTA